MAVVQTTYRNYHDIGQNGQLASTSTYDVDSRQNVGTEAIPFGRALGQPTGDEMGCVLGANEQRFVGISAAGKTLRPQTNDTYAIGDIVSVLIRGDIYVKLSDTVSVRAGDPLLAIKANGSLFGKNHAGAQVNSISIINPGGAGQGYETEPTVIISGGGLGILSEGATATANLNPTIRSVRVVNGGSSFTAVPTIGFTGGGGSGAAATATVASGAISAVTMTNEGTGYTSQPTVTVTGGGGSGAELVAVRDFIVGFTLTDNGSTYSSRPKVTLEGGGYTVPGEARAVMNFNRVYGRWMTTTAAGGVARARLYGTGQPVGEDSPYT